MKNRLSGLFSNNYLVTIVGPSLVFLALFFLRKDINNTLTFVFWVLLATYMIFLLSGTTYAASRLIVGDTSYRTKRAKVAKWIFAHCTTGHKFRLKDIRAYPGRDSDGTLLKHTDLTPDVLVSPTDAFLIVADLQRSNLLEVHVSANRVEEFIAIFSNKPAWERYKVWVVNDLILDPWRFLRDKSVWFGITLFSSAVSVYSRWFLDDVLGVLPN